MIELHETWDDDKMNEMTAALHDAMRPRFAPEAAAAEWEALFEEAAKDDANA